MGKNLSRRHLVISAYLIGSVVAGEAAAEQVFNRIASFPVPKNLPSDKDQATETSAEIAAATEDGMTLMSGLDDAGRPIGYGALSEIIAYSDHVYVVERDSQISGDARIKRARPRAARRDVARRTRW